MNFRDRMYVVNCDAPIVFVNDLCGNLSLNDTAKYALHKVQSVMLLQ
ncbi:hypothetical protein [Methylacidimicrobium cyclopophantes]|nr:hypothetical protein [Methylacidimicrobium cyclopophantes]